MRPAMIACFIASPIRIGFCAWAIALFINTASQPSSMAIVASDAVPTPASTNTGTLASSRMMRRLYGLQMPSPVPISPARRPGRADEGDPRSRALLVAPRTDGGGAALAAALKAAVSVRSARKEGGPVAVRVDPVALG